MFDETDGVLALIDAEIERISTDMNSQPYPNDTRWWMFLKRRFNDGVNTAHQVEVQKLKEIRDAYVLSIGGERR